MLPFLVISITNLFYLQYVSASVCHCIEPHTYVKLEYTNDCSLQANSYSVIFSFYNNSTFPTLETGGILPVVIRM